MDNKFGFGQMETKSIQDYKRIFCVMKRNIKEENTLLQHNNLIIYSAHHLKFF